MDPVGLAPIMIRPRVQPRAGGRALLALLITLPLGAWAQPASAPASGERLLREATRHYDDGRFEASLQLLARAERVSADSATLARVQLQRGVNLAVLGQTAQARQAFALALRHDPAVSLDPGRVKPAIVGLLGSVRADRAATDRGAPEVSVESDASTLRPATRRFAAALAIGGAAGLGSATGGFTLAQELGTHFSRTARGPAIAIALSESFGSKGSGPAGTDARVNLYQVAAKLGWDLQPSARTAFYLCPLLQVGLAYASSAVVASSESGYALAIRAGLETKLILEDRFLLFARPLSLDLLVGADALGRILGDESVSGGSLVLRLDFVVGAGVIF
jgi:hypothetical protein